MTTNIPIVTSTSIREAGLSEYWLQDQIAENPNCLGLGELEVLSKERKQSSGGRLDILLKDPEDDSMFEVEVMLGETDESHIIRTIEYWENEKRRWPLRQHYAVLVAEHINRRFFNVIHLLSQSIPIIAIQCSLIKLGDKNALYFSKILDTFEEIDDGTQLTIGTYDRDYWLKNAKFTLEAADVLLELAAPILSDASLNFVKYYISVSVSGYNYLWLRKRSLNKSLIGFRMALSLQDSVTALLDEANIAHSKKKKEILITIDNSILNKNANIFQKIIALIKDSWESDG